MNCKKEWPLEIQHRELTKMFVNKPLKKHMEDVLFDSQRALMPETLAEYERLQQLKHARKESINANKALENYKRDIDYYSKLSRFAQLHEEIYDLGYYTFEDSQNSVERLEEYSILDQFMRDTHNNTEYILLETERRNKLEILDRLRYQINLESTSHPTETRFIRACPSEGCRGFLSSQWKCGLCELWSCPDCLAVKGPIRDCNHTCNPDDVATKCTLDKDSKPCPQCRSVICKIDGCDQMWCTICRTAFSWRTGVIETRVIHNPHFFEYQRTQRDGLGRTLGDIPCGRHLDIHAIEYMRGIMTATNMPEPIIMRIYQYIRAASHFQEVVIPRYRDDQVVNFRELRLCYISSAISEAQFRARLVRDMKKHQKNIEIGQVVQMLSITLHELIFRFFDEIAQGLAEAVEGSKYANSRRDEDSYENNLQTPISTDLFSNTANLTTLNEIDLLYKYANQCFDNITNIYGTKMIRFEVMGEVF